MGISLQPSEMTDASNTLPELIPFWVSNKILPSPISNRDRDDLVVSHGTSIGVLPLSIELVKDYFKLESQTLATRLISKRVLHIISDHPVIVDSIQAHADSLGKVKKDKSLRIIRESQLRYHPMSTAAKGIRLCAWDDAIANGIMSKTELCGVPMYYVTQIFYLVAICECGAEILGDEVFAEATLEVTHGLRWISIYKTVLSL